MRGSTLIKSLLSPIADFFELDVEFRYVRQEELASHRLLQAISGSGQKLLRWTVSSLLCQIGTRNLRIMQIGANDGVQNDFMREWYNDDRVDAILIEPQDEAFARLSENYKTNPRVRLVNCAVTRDGRSLSLYRFENSNENSIGIDVLASFNKDHVKSWKTRLGLQSNIIQEEYAGKTIASITKMVGWPGVDVLVVDTEGYDFQILGSLQDIGCLPSVVMFEHINLDGATKLMAIDLMKSLQYGIHWGVQDALCIRFDIDDCKS